MVKLIMQSLVQYEIDTETNAVKVLKKFTSPIKGTKQFNKKKPKIVNITTESNGTMYLT